MRRLYLCPAEFAGPVSWTSTSSNARVSKLSMGNAEEIETARAASAADAICPAVAGCTGADALAARGTAAPNTQVPRTRNIRRRLAVIVRKLL
jgi:hypothetical protein